MQVAVLISDRADFKAKREEHYKTREGLILQEDITIPYVYMSNNKASKYTRQKLIEWQGETDESTIRAGDFNILLSEINRFSSIKSVRIPLNSTAPSIDWI